MAKRKSQIIMLDHSKAKVRLLGEYLKKYFNVISNDGYTTKIDVLDLFCGEGVYENDGEGSPLIILKALHDLHINVTNNKNIPKIDLFFNNKDELKISKLKSIIEAKQLHQEKFGKLIYRSKKYEDIIESLAGYINNLKNEKAFIFIDPYGYKEIRASDIKKLLQAKKSEVLLFLPIQFMYRFNEKGTPEALIKILEELVDLKDWKPNNSVYHFINQFKEALKVYLGTNFFVDTFSVEKDVSTVFCLFFFSSHIRGFEKMLETKWEIDNDEGKGWRYEKTSSLFSIFKTNLLEERVIDLLSTKSKVYNGEIYEFTLRNSFLPTHTVEVFNSLQTNNKLEVLSDTSSKVRKGAFYINYENYKETPQKVYYKLK
jgi:three-Cys-motif partner protein